MKEQSILERAKAGDIAAYQQMFAGFQEQLRSFLYRMVASRQDADDLVQDTFVRGFERIKQFKGDASLKTWIFTIGTNLARDLLRTRKRWTAEAQDMSKALAMSTPSIGAAFAKTHENSPQGRYDIREHIDFCFTCIAKILPVDEQVAVLLKDVYSFKRSEIADILGLTEGKVKHLLHGARKTLSSVFYKRCALVNQAGTCHQCTELAGIYNPRQARQRHLQKLELVAEAAQTNDQRKLYQLRAALVKFIDPLESPGADMQDIIMQCTRAAFGEIGEKEVRFDR